MRSGFQKRLITALASMLLSATPSVLLAHHSTAAYDASKVLTLTGTVRQVKWVNPHSYIIMEIPSKAGQEQWQILSGTPTLNVRNGWKYDDVKVGDKVTVVVHPARNANQRAGILRRITLADGRSIAGPREFLAVPTEGQQPPSP